MMLQQTLNTNSYDTFLGLKLKKMGLFQKYRELHLMSKHTKELQAICLALDKNSKAFCDITDFSLALNNLDEREMFLNKAKEIFYQIQDRRRRLYQEISRQAQQEYIMIESRINDALDDVFVVRILLKIVFEGRDKYSFFDRLWGLFDWLELKRPAAIFREEEKIIADQKWEVITVNNSQCRYWDDMPEHIRRRHRKFKQMYEERGCHVFYDTSPSLGTKITIEIPPEIVEGKFVLTDKIFENLDNPFLDIARD